MAYKSIHIELSGRCNAKCRYCVTGLANLNDRQHMPMMQKNIMHYDMFRAIMEHLFKKKIADGNTTFGFYNWGEPLLNSECKLIFKYMYDNKLKYNLSTNGSVQFPFSTDIPNEFFNNLTTVILSFPGFSQRSYNRIHGFNFETIKKNVIEITKGIKNKGGSKSAFVMNYHLYQFNSSMEEMMEAWRFCKKYNIYFLPSYAFINDFKRAIAYLSNNLPYDELKMMGKDLNFSYVDELIDQRPPGYKCPEFERLTIDENGKLLQCCGPKEAYGDILAYDCQQIDEIRNNALVCNECRMYKLDYWTHNPKVFNFFPSNKYVRFLSRVIPL